MDQAEKLKKLKEKMGLTNSDMALLLASSERALYHWLSGDRRMNRWTEMHLDRLLEAACPDFCASQKFLEIS